MSTSYETVPTPAFQREVELSELCGSMFWSLARADQRRWAEMYVRGLVAVPGRKSIRRIAEQVVGYRADQSLQQFLNQSPWDSSRVRANLANRLWTTMRPQAWVFAEVAFPKHGDNSVAVTRQYAHSLGRTVNCQLGIAALLASGRGSCPVDWRLALPRCWDDDDDRRTRTRVPADERHRPWQSHVLDIITEMADGWGLPPAPVLVDSRNSPQVDPLLRGLAGLGVRYAVQVCGGTPVRPARVGAPPAAVSPPVPVSEAAAAIPHSSRTTIAWWDGGQMRRSQLAVVPIAGEPAVHRIVPGRGHQPPPRLVVEWTSGVARPAGMWVTNLNTTRLPDLVGLLRLAGTARTDLDRMNDESGLRHFEGRSFRGWHHHVTLVSIAHAYRLLCELGDENAARYN
jgi:SRSO17 transposase